MSAPSPDHRSLLDAHRVDILTIAARHGAENVRVFGSFARGDATDRSHVDLLVSVGEKTSAWFPAGLIDDLEALLGRRVEVVTEPGIYRLLRRRILQEARAL